jgi:hypothetical protein
MHISSAAKFSGSLACALACALLLSCKASLPPHEVTADGLERMPSRASAGVYRAPGAPFIQYQRLILEPLSIEFRKGWREQHRELDESGIKRLLDQARKNFREEFVEILIDEGPYTFADEPAPDVLIVSPAITDLDIPGPDAGASSDKRTLTPRRIGMRITGDLRDAATGKLVGRVDTYDGGEQYGIGSGELREANRVTNSFEMTRSFEKWSQLLREALDVAKVERPRVGIGPDSPNGAEPRE